jgi:hypothetical protein
LGLGEGEVQVKRDLAWPAAANEAVEQPAGRCPAAGRHVGEQLAQAGGGQQLVGGEEELAGRWVGAPGPEANGGRLLGEIIVAARQRDQDALAV